MIDKRVTSPIYQSKEIIFYINISHINKKKSRQQPEKFFFKDLQYFLAQFIHLQLKKCQWKYTRNLLFQTKNDKTIPVIKRNRHHLTVNFTTSLTDILSLSNKLDSHIQTKIYIIY